MSNITNIIYFAVILNVCLNTFCIKRDIYMKHITKGY